MSNRTPTSPPPAPVVGQTFLPPVVVDAVTANQARLSFAGRSLGWWPLEDIRALMQPIPPTAAPEPAP